MIMYLNLVLRYFELYQFASCAVHGNLNQICIAQKK